MAWRRFSHALPRVGVSVTLFLLASVALASPAWRECRVSVGEAQSCSATAYNGEVPVERPGGRVYDCAVSVGVVRSCPTPHTGDAPLVRDGKVVRCSVDHGIVSRCDATGFTGTAVLLR